MRFIHVAACGGTTAHFHCYVINYCKTKLKIFCVLMLMDIWVGYNFGSDKLCWFLYMSLFLVVICLDVKLLS